MSVSLRFTDGVHGGHRFIGKKMCGKRFSSPRANLGLQATAFEAPFPVESMRKPIGNLDLPFFTAHIFAGIKNTQ